MGPEPFDESAFRPALEGQSAGFDALHDVIALDKSLFRLADRVVCGLDAVVEDCRYLPLVLAVLESARDLIHDECWGPQT